MTSLHVICGLGPPNQKSWLRLWLVLRHIMVNPALINRGEIEDTRLEAKAKDTKKSEAKDSLSENRHSRGQGQECSRPRPRTKDKSASALQEKKGLYKNFSSNLHRKTFSKKFFKCSTKFYDSKNSAILEPRTGQFSRT